MTLDKTLRQWLQQGYTANETPLDGYGAEVVREVLAALSSAPPDLDERVRVVAPAPVVRAPEVVIEDDGDVCIDFDHAPDRVVSIMLHSDGTWSWSAIVGGHHDCARGTPLPAWVLAALSPRETAPGGGR